MTFRHNPTWLACNIFTIFGGDHHSSLRCLWIWGFLTLLTAQCKPLSSVLRTKSSGKYSRASHCRLWSPSLWDSTLVMISVRLHKPMRVNSCSIVWKSWLRFVFEQTGSSVGFIFLSRFLLTVFGSPIDTPFAPQIVLTCNNNYYCFQMLLWMGHSILLSTPPPPPPMKGIIK